ncbi:hypothetical protein FA13DRAFT_1796778 [Coprinellus micaceus]|uniref:JmjC domain-containing protein n=1 Tax=Coprinellus micaceus TaxID=71717 RepID=A0A4Y7SSS6_COPMI|nr:hypothetical protein FA13DRAFT_1796778 [Coprinellus micaceus]
MSPTPSRSPRRSPGPGEPTTKTKGPKDPLAQPPSAEIAVSRDQGQGDEDVDDEKDDEDQDDEEQDDEEQDDGDQAGDGDNEKGKGVGEDEGERMIDAQDEGEMEVVDEGEESNDEHDELKEDPPQETQDEDTKGGRKRTTSKGSKFNNPIIIDDDDDESSEAAISCTKRIQEKVLHHIDYSIKYSPTTLDVKPQLTEPDYKAWKRLLDHVIRDYSDVHHTGTRRPLHLDDPERSAISIVSAKDFRGNTAKEVQTAFGRRNIAIPKDPTIEGRFRGLPCDEDTASKDLTHVHDQHSAVKKQNHQCRVTLRSLSDVHASTQLPPDQQKSLNALDFPDPYAKVAKTSIFSGKEFDIMNLDPKKFRFELLYLKRGDKFIMQPNTVHAVLTLQHCIAYGGHFLAISTLARTIIGGVHTFFQGSITTNTDHPSILTRIDSVIAFLHKTLALGDIDEQDQGHLPTFDSVQSLQDLLIVACGVELQNATCSESYEVTTDPVLLCLLQMRKETADQVFEKHDISKMPYDTRCMAVHSRGRIYDPLKVIFQQVDIVDETGNLIEDPWHHLFVPTLAWFIAGLKGYYRDSARISGHSLPKLQLFERQLRWTISSQQWPTLEAELSKLKRKWVSNFICPPPVSAVRPKANPPPRDGEKEPLELFRAGLRRGDDAYFSVVTPPTLVLVAT